MDQQTELTAADGHVLSAYRAGSATATRALVVVQEIFGVNAHMRHVCDELAGHGYRVIAPALFDRVERNAELHYDEAGLKHGLELRAAISEQQVMEDIEAAAQAVATPGQRIGIIGYCWGGTIAWWGATRSRRFAAAIGWYGGGIAQTRHETPHCPVQLHFGETDASIPMTDVEHIRQAQPKVDVFTYPQAGHGFGCAERSSYNAAACQLAQERSLAFLAAHL